MKETTLEDPAIKVLISSDGIIGFLEENIGEAFARPGLCIERNMNLRWYIST